MTEPEIEKALRTRYDALNQAITLAEQKLKALKPPCAVWLSDSGGVGFAKVDSGQWRLVYWSKTERKDGFPAVTPLVEQPLMVRVAAVSGDNLRRLHEAIVAAKEEFVPEVEAAIRTVEEFLRE